MATFLSLAVSATMFPQSGSIDMYPLTPEDVRSILHINHAANEVVVVESGGNIEGPIISALNPSHASTIEVIRRKFDLSLPIPEKAPKVSLNDGDSIVIIQANLPRLAEGEVHSDETVGNAPISFRLWTVVPSED